MGLRPERSAVMSYLELLISDNDIRNIVNRMPSPDLTGEVCLFSYGNGFSRRVTALF